MFFSQALVGDRMARDVRVMLEDERIDAVAVAATPEGADERHAIGLRGLCNLHSRGCQRGMAGLTETGGPGEDDFWTWRSLMYRFLDRLQPDDVEALTAQAYVEDSWSLASARPAIDAVWVGGRKLVSQGRHIRRDEVAARFAATLQRLASQ